MSEEFVEKFVDHDHYASFFDQDNSDYVYRTLDLIQLSGRKYYKKKNLLNRFMKNFAFECRHLDMEFVECLLDIEGLRKAKESYNLHHMVNKYTLGPKISS